MSVIEDEQTGVNIVSSTRDTPPSAARHAIRLLLLLLACLLPYPLVAASPERISVAYSIDSIPFQYTDENGEPNGIIIDYWKLWSEKTGIAVDFIEATWNETLALVRDGKADAHAGLFFNEQRDRYLDYGAALTKTDTNVFFHNSVEIPRDLSKLSAYRVGVLGKDFVEGYLQKRLAAGGVIGFPDYSQIMDKLWSGELKLFAADTPTGLFHLAQAGLLAKFHYNKSAPLYQNDWFVASSEGNAGMLELINQGMALITPEERKHIERRWVSGMPGEASDAIIIAISSNYAPFATIGVDGKPSGYLVDLWREWARRVGRDIEFRATKWTDTLSGMKSGEADIHSGLFKSRKRDAWLAFSRPFLEIETAVYFKSGKGDSVSLNQLADAKVGVIRGSFQEEYLDGKHPGKQKIPYTDIDELLTGLLLEEVEAAVAEVPEMTSALSRLGITGAARQGDSLFTEEVHAAVLEDNASLLALVNRGLAAIPSDTLADIKERWISQGLDWKSVIAWVAPVVGGSLLIIIFVAVWNRRLGREVLERKRAELALVDAKEAADTLRTPMNAILGYSEMLMEEAEDLDQEDFIPDLKKINQAGYHLLSLINDVLDLSKIESGKMEAFADIFDVGALIDQVAGTAQPLMTKNNNQFSIERGEQLGSAFQDVTKIRQSLLNMLSNAAKFTQKGTITLRAEREKVDGVDWLSFAVTDTGIGIPADKLDHVFEEFSQADSSTTRDYGGTGLGLTISRRFCQMLGGDMVVTSQPGVGSTFSIRLPAELPGAEAPQEESPQANTDVVQPSDDVPQATPGSTILVIDDDADACELIRRFLEKDGFNIVTACSGEQGLRLAQEIQPAAITLDVMMPDMDGWSVLRVLKADPELRTIPVIMLTMIDERTRGYSLGAVDYLTKPVDRDLLHKTLIHYYSADSASTVLLVEDDLDAREIMARTLEQAGWTVSEAGNGQEALDIMSDLQPRLILLDLMMPVMDGFGFLAELRAQPEWQQIPVIVITAKDLSADDRDRLAGNVEEVLEKNAYTREELLERVSEAVAACNIRQAEANATEKNDE